MAPFNHSSRVHPTFGINCRRSKFGKNRSGSAAFSPLNVSSLIRWWDADEGISLGAGNNIDTWTDRKGSVAAQSPASNEPQYAATGGPNSNPAVGASPSQQFNEMSFSGGPYAYPWTIMVVAQFTGTANGGRNCIAGDNAPSFWGVGMDQASGTNRLAYLSNGSGFDVSSSEIDASWHIITYKIGNTDSQIWVDGVSVFGPGGSGSTSSLSQIRLFTGDLGTTFEGNTTDILVFSDALSEDDRKALESHFATEHNLTVTHS